MTPLALPAAPHAQRGPVKAWFAPLVIPTYEPAPPDKNPRFVENRVYQGSSGRVYPLPCIDQVATTATDRTWHAVHLENAYVRVMILPELGGRIHIGMDKTNGYDFFYRQNVIKPALVGLAGPWISGGVEFNWPQHHRPATFMPVDYHIEACADGSAIVWCSDHDPISRMKGMHGVCLYPDRSYIELKVRLFNRTPYVHTFLWWANMGVHVHEQYQSFFPPDVTHIADHAKRAISEFPLCQGVYYGVDYGRRARNGVPDAERPRHYQPPGTYPPNDLSWYANLPVPTSYMVAHSEKDFFGGYDHLRQAGVVHVADHHIAPGKKQWTWGNHDFGYAWDRHLTDGDGPYIELMAGVYTDNQPDFSFLMPGETKTFSQYWYPIRQIGPPREANRNAALSVRAEGGEVNLGIIATGSFPASSVELLSPAGLIFRWIADLSPGSAWMASTRLPTGCEAADLSVVVWSGGLKLIASEPALAPGGPAIQAANEPPLPESVNTNDELFLIGLHLEQYRHATRRAESYWQEALRRDPGDARCHNALGKWRLKRGEFPAAEAHFRRAIERSTALNQNPYDGEPYYHLGLTLRFLGRKEEARTAFYKATWNAAWRAPALFALAQMAAGEQSWEKALDHLSAVLRLDADQLRARSLMAVTLRELNRPRDADTVLAESQQLDLLDCWTASLQARSVGDNQARLDVAFEYIDSGLYEAADLMLASCETGASDGSVPMVLYSRAFCCRALGWAEQAAKWEQAAAQASPDYCFSSRLEELIILESVLAHRPKDARAHYYLGNFLYDRGRRSEAISHWEQSVEEDAANSVCWRNMSVAYFNVHHDLGRAERAIDAALAADPGDARLLYERDQLLRCAAADPLARRERLAARPELVALRDDLTAELAGLYNQTAEPEQALQLLQGRQFHPWEGGEGTVLLQFVRAQLALGRAALLEDCPQAAIERFEAALRPPPSLGEDWHLLANRSHVYYWLGAAHEALERHVEAAYWWERAAKSNTHFQEMSVRPHSEMTYYSALALRALGRPREAKAVLRDLLQYARALLYTPQKIDYFATSLPAMLLFREDSEKRNRVIALFLEAQASMGLGYGRHGRRLLNQVSQLDPGYWAVADYRDELRAQAILSQRAPA